MDLETLYREERPRALATLIRLLRDFDLAEEMLQEAFAVAVEQWPAAGTPRQPVRVARLDRPPQGDRPAAPREELRRQADRDRLPRRDRGRPLTDLTEEPFPDDLLRLVFTCCHPALALEAQVALTLKTLCGLSVEEIARAFLVSPATMAQRLVRAKRKIHAARIPYEVPGSDHLAERLDGVLRVVYLVFNEGYAATSGDALVRRELCAEAIRLGRVLRGLLPAAGDRPASSPSCCSRTRAAPRASTRTASWSRSRSRTAACGTATRSSRGRASRSRRCAAAAAGFYALQAAIAALHAQAARAEETDWPQIAALYALLLRLHPSPVVALNHAAAVAMGDQLDRGLRLIEQLEQTGELQAYHLLPAAKADILRRLARPAEAAAAYEQALQLVTQDAERRYLERRLREVRSPGRG